MRYFLFILLLTACGASPAPEFMGAKRVDVTRDGRAYALYYTQRRAEVIRLGYAEHGDHQGVRATMIDLIPQVTGCRLLRSSVQGDSGEIRGSIACPKE